MKSISKKLVLLFMAGILISVLNGCCLSHEWLEPTCTAPFICAKCGKTDGEPLGHSYVDATCEEPEHCTVCNLEKSPALGHTPSKATCEDPSVCTVCDKILGDALGHSWIEATSTTPQTCSVCNKMVPMEQPKNGAVVISTKKSRYSSITINNTNSGFNCYVKIKDTNGNDVMSFYVHAGETAKVKVPAIKCYAYFARGTAWYGPEHLFGENTVRYKDNDMLNCKNYTYTYTMNTSGSGNSVNESYVSAGDF